MYEVRDRIIQRMKELNLRQVDLINLTGLSKGTISKWISGTNTPSSTALPLLATALQTTPDWIIKGKDIDFEPNNKNDIEYNHISLNANISTELSPIALSRRNNTLKLLKSNGLNQRQLADALNMKAPLLSAYLGKNPKKSIGNEVAKRICEYFKIEPIELDIDLDYIQLKSNEGNIFDKNNLNSQQNFVKVPFYTDARASCGLGYFNNDNVQDVEMITIDKSKLVDRYINPSNVKVLPTDGDSMLPAIPHGARVFLDTSRNTIGRDGSIYAICRGGLLSIKHLFKMPNDSIRIVSANPDKTLYPDIILNKSDMETESFQILGQVFHVDYPIPF